jgi:Heavy metal binding domain
MGRKVFLKFVYAIGFMISIISCGNKHTSLRTSAGADVAYFCPMDTTINETKRGHCSACGMNLIKNPNYKGIDVIEVVVTSTGDTLKN